VGVFFELTSADCALLARRGWSSITYLSCLWTDFITSGKPVVAMLQNLFFSFQTQTQNQLGNISMVHAWSCLFLVCVLIEQHVLDTNAGKQLSEAVTDVYLTLVFKK
jgi:hypothetical protein